MFSPVKKADKELLLEIAEVIQVLVKVGTTEAMDLAEKFGKDYIRLETKIRTYDYSTEDIYDSNITGLCHDKTLGLIRT